MRLLFVIFCRQLFIIPPAVTVAPSFSAPVDSLSASVAEPTAPARASETR